MQIITKQLEICVRTLKNHELLSSKSISIIHCVRLIRHRIFVIPGKGATN